MATPEALVRVVVCDAGPLIHLDELGCTDLLNDFADVLVPAAVWREVQRHRPEALARSGMHLRQVTISDPLPADLAEIARVFALHSGELQALQVHRQQAADLFLTDDTAARLAARSIGIAVHGTIGVILRSIRRRQRTAEQVLDILKALPGVSTLHIKQTVLDEVIRNVETSQ